MRSPQSTSGAKTPVYKSSPDNGHRSGYSNRIEHPPAEKKNTHSSNGDARVIALENSTSAPAKVTPQVNSIWHLVLLCLPLRCASLD